MWLLSIKGGRMSRRVREEAMLLRGRYGVVAGEVFHRGVRVRAGEIVK